jgi:hypothetical protein
LQIALDQRKLYISTLSSNCDTDYGEQGMLDELFPIEDSMLMMQHGSVKEARFFEGVKHMGEPFAMPVALEWVGSVFKGIQSESGS